jgi:ATP-binding cassette subfamily B protein
MSDAAQSKDERAAHRANQARALRALMPHLWSGLDGACARVLAALAACQAKRHRAHPFQAHGRWPCAAGGSCPDGSDRASLAYGIARVVLGWRVRDGIFARVAQRAIRAWRHHLPASPHASLVPSRPSDRRAAPRGREAPGDRVPALLRDLRSPTILEIALVCGILWYAYDWRFAVVTGGTILCYISYTLAITEWRIKYRRQMNESDQAANTKAVDSLLNFETVKYFNNEEHEARRYDVARRAYEEAAGKTRSASPQYRAGDDHRHRRHLIMALAASGVAAGRMTVGDFVMVNAYLIKLYLPLNFLGTVYREIRQALIDMETMFALLGVDVDIKDKPGARPLVINRGEIAFEHVDFGYDPRRPILKDVSFRVPAGHTLAIVGPSGAGKSTISRLLFRFYDVTDGRILIDGQDIRDVGQQSVRAAIGIVPQDTVLFNDTVEYNIGYGRPEASRAEITGRFPPKSMISCRIAGRLSHASGERGLKPSARSSASRSRAPSGNRLPSCCSTSDRSTLGPSGRSRPPRNSRDRPRS